jgi:hypothetical protein
MQAAPADVLCVGIPLFDAAMGALLLREHLDRWFWRVPQ